MSARKAAPELTPAQVRALVAAVDSYLNAGTMDECITIFGSAQGVEAAARASDELKRAGNAIGTWAPWRRLPADEARIGG